MLLRYVFNVAGFVRINFVAGFISGGIKQFFLFCYWVLYWLRFLGFSLCFIYGWNLKTALVELDLVFFLLKKGLFLYSSDHIFLFVCDISGLNSKIYLRCFVATILTLLFVVRQNWDPGGGWPFVILLLAALWWLVLLRLLILLLLFPEIVLLLLLLVLLLVLIVLLTDTGRNSKNC